MGSPAWSRGAMVAASNPLAVQAGLWALAEGGTAMDAALASDAVLGVVQPMSTGMGGDAFCLVDDGTEVTGFNGSGGAPAGLTLDVARAGWERAVAAGEVSERYPALPDASPLTVTVPGAVDAWSQLSERFGRLRLDRVTRPARELAAGGFPVGRVAALGWEEASARLQPGSPFPANMAAGQRFTNPRLAASLEAIAAGGREAHYTGAFAAEAATVIQAAGGVLAVADMAGHRGEWTTPITVSYRGYEICQHPPNGQGAAVLAALARRDAEPAGGPEDPETVVAVMEAVREGMSAAFRHVADPRFAAVPEFWAGKPGETVYTAAYSDGMAVSLISSVSAGFGSGYSAGGTMLQNRGAGFAVDAGQPNAVAPGKRPFHTIIPALIRRDGATWAVFGLVGGLMQPQGHVQVMSHLIDHGRDPQSALDAPRARWLFGNGVGLEAGFPPAVADAFRAAGWEVAPEPERFTSMGVGQVIRIHRDGWLSGGSDPRHDGVAAGMPRVSSRRG